MTIIGPIHQVQKTFRGDELIARSRWVDTTDNSPPPFKRKIGPYQLCQIVRKSGLASDAYWRPYPSAYLGWWLIGRCEWTPILNASYYSNSVNGTLFSTYHRNEAIYRMQSKMRAGDFNLGVTGAEAAKTVRMITDTATRVYTAARALRRGRLGDLYRALNVAPPDRYRRNVTTNGPNGPVRAQRLKYPPPKKVRENAGNYWMEANYGWKPLLADIKNGCETVANLLNQPDVDILYAQGRSGRGSSYSTSFAQGASTYRLVMSWDVTETYGCRVDTYYRIRNGNIATAAKLGLTNPMLIAWELVPLSFVVDWFLPVGKFLEQISAYHGLEFVRGFQTQVGKIACLGRKTGGTYDVSGDAFGSVFHMKRDRLTDFPTAGLLVKDPISVSHGVTAVALAQQMLGKLFRK